MLLYDLTWLNHKTLHRLMQNLTIDLIVCRYSYRWVILETKYYSKTCLKGPFSKRQKFGFQDQLSLNAVQKYCRMLQGEHSAILWTFIKLPLVIKIFVLSVFQWPFFDRFYCRSVPKGMGKLIKWSMYCLLHSYIDNTEREKITRA